MYSVNLNNPKSYEQMESPEYAHYSYCNLIQDETSLAEIKRMTGDNSITAAMFDTSNGGYDDLHVAYGRPGYNRYKPWFPVIWIDAQANEDDKLTMQKFAKELCDILADDNIKVLGFEYSEDYGHDVVDCDYNIVDSDHTFTLYVSLRDMWREWQEDTLNSSVWHDIMVCENDHSVNVQKVYRIDDDIIAVTGFYSWSWAN